MHKLLALLAAVVMGCCFTATAQEEMSWKDAKKAMKEARRWMREHPEEAAQYQQQTNAQAQEALRRTAQAIEEANVPGMYDSQASQGTLGHEYAAGAASAKKEAEARLRSTPREVLVPVGPGYTCTGSKKHPLPAYNDKRYALAPQPFVAGTRTIIDWSKSVVPASKWVYQKREVGSAFYKAPKSVKWQGKQAVALSVCELEPNLGTEYLPENFSLEFDIWSCPATSTLPQDYSDNFFHIVVWGDINEPLLDLNFTPNTPGPHGYVDGFDMQWNCIDTHSKAYDQWEHAATNMKPKAWTHVAISFNARDISVYVNGVCHACYNRAYVYGLPRVFWFTTQNFRDKNAYLANVKVCGY